MANLSLRGIKKTYEGDVTAVHDFSLEIADKEFVVLVGPSGCGKSTTLRMIAGLEEITDGELYIGDRLVNDTLPKDRDIAMVFQNYALYPHMTVHQNMAFALKLRKMSKADIDKKVNDVADILGITDLLSRKPRALSGGQRQRVAIGRAIVREPQVFLMDEPLSNLDAKLRNQMRAELIKLRKRVDTTFVYVTHDQTEAMTLGDRIVIMKDGYIQQVGTPQQVFNSPSNVFVAGFIGTPQMNFFDGVLRTSGNEIHAEISGVRIALSDAAAANLRGRGITDGEVTIGTRPEHIQLVNKGANGAIKADVEVSELMGSEVYLHCAVDGKEMIMRVPTTELSRDYDAAKVVGDIYFTCPPALTHVFDKQTGENIGISL